MSIYVNMFVLAIIFGAMGNYFGHKKKNIKRTKIGVLAVGLVSSFLAFLLSLILMKVVALNAYLLTVLVCFSYSYVMANAQAFSEIS